MYLLCEIFGFYSYIVITAVFANTMDQSGITPNTSNQQLVINSDNDSATALLQEKQSRRRETLRDVTFLEYMTVGILCFVNLINYMDRFTLAGKSNKLSTTFYRIII